MTSQSIGSSVNKDLSAKPNKLDSRQLRSAGVVD